MPGLDVAQIPTLILLGYMLFVRPARHFAAIEREFRFVSPIWMRVGRGSIEAIAIFAATALSIGLVIAMLPRVTSSGLLGDLIAVALVYLLTDWITCYVLRIRARTNRFDSTTGRPMLFRSIVLDHLFRDAVWSKLKHDKASIEELEEVARDPAKRAALLTEHIESVQLWGWIRVDRKIAKLHDGYYWHPPVLGLFLLGVLFDQLQQIIVDLQTRHYAETAELVRRSAALLFGAAFYPVSTYPALPYAREMIQLAPLVMVMLFTFANPVARYALTLMIIGYFGISLNGLPEAIAQWNAHAMVRQWKQFVQVLETPVLGTVAKSLAGVASNGMSDVAISLQRFWASIGPSAWVGVSMALWAPFVFKLVRHLWISEIGNLYFASCIRRPLSCGAPAKARLPKFIIHDVLFEKAGLRLSRADRAKLRSGGGLHVGPRGKFTVEPTLLAAAGKRLPAPQAETVPPPADPPAPQPKSEEQAIKAA